LAFTALTRTVLNSQFRNFSCGEQSVEPAMGMPDMCVAVFAVTDMCVFFGVGLLLCLFFKLKWQCEARTVEG